LLILKFNLAISYDFWFALAQSSG